MKKKIKVSINSKMLLQIKSGKIFYLHYLTLSPELSAWSKNQEQYIFERTGCTIRLRSYIFDLGVYSKGSTVLYLILHDLLKQPPFKGSGQLNNYDGQLNNYDVLGLGAVDYEAVWYAVIKNKFKKKF